MIKQLTAMLLMLACTPDHKPAGTSYVEMIASLGDAFTSHDNEFKDATAAQGFWPSITDCDGTVFAGMACLAGENVQIEIAENPAGEIQRRPKDSGACWLPGDTTEKNHGAATTGSRDDYVLYAACAYQLKDVAALTRFLDYGEEHSWFMGFPHNDERVILGTNLQGIIARAEAALGAPRRGYADYFPPAELPGVKDFQKHIEVEEILFSSTVSHGATDLEMRLLESLANGKDALFEAALGRYTGDCEVAPRLLLASPVAVPSYVRGDQPRLFALAWWLWAARIVLDHCEAA